MSGDHLDAAWRAACEAEELINRDLCGPAVKPLREIVAALQEIVLALRDDD